MNFSIHWKLILSLTMPLLLVLGVAMFFDWWRMREDAIEEMQRDLKIQAVSYADRLDTRFEAIELVAQSTANVLEARGGRGAHVGGLLRASLDNNPLIASARIALLPDRLRRIRPLAIQLTNEDGQVRPEPIHDRVNYQDMPWFELPIRLERGVWIEADHDPLVDNHPVATYAVPFKRADDTIGGVVALSVRLDNIQNIVNWGLGDIEGFAVIDNKERFVSHPDPTQLLQSRWRQEFDEKLPKKGDELMAATMEEPVVVQIMMHSTAEAAGHGADDEELFWLAFAPIKTTNWVFVTALPETSVLPQVMQAVYRRTAFGLVVLGIVLGLIAVVSVRMVRPIEHIAEAVDEVSKGNFDVVVKDTSEGKSGDEVRRLANGVNTMVEQIKKQINALTRETAARERVESELRIARDIQTSLLPQAFPPFPDHQEFSLHAINLPAKQVAGDFFDFFFTNDGKLTVVIADVSGKGVPAAMLMAVTRTLIRNRASMGAQPSEIVEYTNNLLFEDNNGSMFVTMFVCQYELSTGKLVYVNAGHPPPYRCRAGESPKVFGQVTAPLVGACEAGLMGPFEQASEQLQPGDTLLMFTDGVTEARSPQDTMLHEQGLVDTLVNSSPDDVSELCDYIAKTVDEFQAHNPIDDVTVVALRRNV